MNNRQLILIITLLVSSSAEGICGDGSVKYRKQDSDRSLKPIKKVERYLNLGKQYASTKSDSALIYYHRGLELLNNISVKDAVARNSLKMEYLYGIGDLLVRSQPDSAIRYFNQSLRLYYKLPQVEQLKKENLEVKGNIFKDVGRIFANRSDDEKAISYYEKALKEFERISNYKGQSIALNNIGLVYNNCGNYTKAIDYYLKSLDFAELAKDKNWKASVIYNISAIFEGRQVYDRAMYYLQQALSVFLEVGNTHNAAVCYLELGNIALESQGNFDSALVCYNKAIPILKKNKDYSNISSIYGNIGVGYDQIDNFEKAKENYGYAIGYSEISGNRKKIATHKSGLASLYLNEYEKTKDLAYLNTAMELAVESKDINEHFLFGVEDRYELFVLSEIYKIKKDFRRALKYRELYQANQDSLFNKEKAKIISQTETRFLMEKKQQEINMLEKNRELVEVRMSKQKAIIISILGGLILLFVSVIVVFYRLQTSKKQKFIIEEHKNQLELQNEEILLQKSKIEEQQNSIIDSIEYAQLIQQAVLPNFPEMDFVKGHFLVYHPRDIVSGDFYWFTHTEDKFIFTLADCTGHGVPGGFLSMLGMSYLTDIINREGIYNPAAILDRLRDRVIDSLQQRDERNVTKDGLDIAICVYDIPTKKVLFAGAGSALYITSKTGELQIVKGDRQPVAIHPLMKPFTFSEYTVNPGDNLYLCSDGYRDQFNTNMKKFGIVRFKELLISVANLDMEEQKMIFEDTIVEWAKGYVQIDDISLLGIKF